MTVSKSDTIKVFEHGEFGSLRVVERDGETWFVAADVCRALGLGNVTEALRGLDDDELNSVVLNSGGQGREMSIISEAGLYSLVLRSRKPEAKPFRRWVTHDILPSIAKTGRYDISAPALPDFTSPAEAARSWAEQYEQRALAERKFLALDAQAQADRPKVLHSRNQMEA